jgi:hypothetical protein
MIFDFLLLMVAVWLLISNVLAALVLTVAAIDLWPELKRKWKNRNQ